VGKELFYTNEIKIDYFMRSAFPARSAYLSGSPREFRRILIHDVWMSKQQLRLIGHAYIHTLELNDG